MVERHINVLKEMLTRLADEEKEALDPPLLRTMQLERTPREAYGGRSPRPWFMGRNLTDEIVGGKS